MLKVHFFKKNYALTFETVKDYVIAILEIIISTMNLKKMIMEK